VARAGCDVTTPEVQFIGNMRPPTAGASTPLRVCRMDFHSHSISKLLHITADSKWPHTRGLPRCGSVGDREIPQPIHYRECKYQKVKSIHQKQNVIADRTYRPTVDPFRLLLMQTLFCLRYLGTSSRPSPVVQCETSESSAGCVVPGFCPRLLHS